MKRTDLKAVCVYSLSFDDTNTLISPIVMERSNSETSDGLSRNNLQIDYPIVNQTIDSALEIKVNDGLLKRSRINSSSCPGSPDFRSSPLRHTTIKRYDSYVSSEDSWNTAAQELFDKLIPLASENEKKEYSGDFDF